jgi:hypothetical protein
MSRLHTEHRGGDNHHRHYPSVQHHYNAAYQLDRYEHQHDNGGTDINDLDWHDDVYDSRGDHASDRPDDYVHVRRADYDNLVAALDNFYDGVVYTDDDLHDAARNLVKHVNDDTA